MASVEENGLRIRWIGCRAVVETVEVERRMEVGYERSYVEDSFHSSTLEHRSKGEEPLLDVDLNEAFDYLQN
ncbi:hypothetical protein ALC60_00750 [Trachymyrmex zeteki]|uniref:Uncharacterized protein n=1 Tax=Mycetomoellerius zeteki TaxID=64791 RepID=A0A151XIW4_9HYME|nr:hypothetical protein ALC60_00750 [Trachymyrmex zeteki]